MGQLEVTLDPHTVASAPSESPERAVVDAAQRRRVMVLLGTRPEAVKLAPVIRALADREELTVTVVVTGQHRELLDQVLETFSITPDDDLRLMDQWAGRVPSLAELTTHALMGVDAALEKHRPDVVVVQGDTTTVLAGALACFYRRTPVAHVEAGLRTHELYDPFPEEGNRRLTAALAAVHFAPTEQARINLLREGISSDAVHVTGNTVVDALQQIAQTGLLANGPRSSDSSASPSRPRLAAPPGSDSRTILVTLHRRENWGGPMSQVARALRRVLDAVPDAELILPMHPNPVVRQSLTPVLCDHPRARLVEPLDYVSLLRVMSSCYVVATDSGGIQEEAPVFGKPVLVLRETTERPEGIAAGVARLVGTSEDGVFDALHEILVNRAAYDQMAHAASPYGDGHAARRIADILAMTVAGVKPYAPQR